jgi:HEAT repeat protein
VGQDDPHLLLEALWAYQHVRAVNEPLLKRLLRSPEPRARAAATRVLWAWRGRIANPLDLLRTQADDEHPRVRLEAVRALSFFDSEEAREIARSVRVEEDDPSLKYARQETLATLDERLKR